MRATQCDGEIDCCSFHYFLESESKIHTGSIPVCGSINVVTISIEKSARDSIDIDVATSVEKNRE